MMHGQKNIKLFNGKFCHLLVLHCTWL